MFKWGGFFRGDKTSRGGFSEVSDITKGMSPESAKYVRDLVKSVNKGIDPDTIRATNNGGTGMANQVVGSDGVNNAVYAAMVEADPVAALTKLRDEGTVDNNEVALQEIENALKIFGEGTDAEVEKAIKAALDATLTNAERTAKNISELGKAREAGGISLRQYTDKGRGVLKGQLNVLFSGPTIASEEDVLAYFTAQKEYNATISGEKAKLAGQRIEELKAVGGGDQEVAAFTIAENLKIIDSPGGDPEARRSAALQIVEASRVYYSNALAAATDTAEAQKILDQMNASDSDINKALDELLNAKVQSTSEYKLGAAAYQQSRKENRAGIDPEIGPDTLYANAQASLAEAKNDPTKKGSDSSFTQTTQDDLATRLNSLSRDYNLSTDANERDQLKRSYDFVAGIASQGGMYAPGIGFDTTNPDVKPKSGAKDAVPWKAGDKTKANNGRNYIYTVDEAGNASWVSEDRPPGKAGNAPEMTVVPNSDESKDLGIDPNKTPASGGGWAPEIGKKKKGSDGIKYIYTANGWVEDVGNGKPKAGAAPLTADQEGEKGLPTSFDPSTGAPLDQKPQEAAQAGQEKVGKDGKSYTFNGQTGQWVLSSQSGPPAPGQKPMTPEEAAAQGLPAPLGGFMSPEDWIASQKQREEDAITYQNSVRYTSDTKKSKQKLDLQTAYLELVNADPKAIAQVALDTATADEESAAQFGTTGGKGKESDEYKAAVIAKMKAQKAVNDGVKAGTQANTNVAIAWANAASDPVAAANATLQGAKDIYAQGLALNPDTETAENKQNAAEVIKGAVEVKKAEEQATLRRFDLETVNQAGPGGMSGSQSARRAYERAQVVSSTAVGADWEIAKIDEAQKKQELYRADVQTYLQGMDARNATDPSVGPAGASSARRASNALQRAQTQLFFAGLGGNADEIALGQIAVSDAEEGKYKADVDAYILNSDANAAEVGGAGGQSSSQKANSAMERAQLGRFFAQLGGNSDEINASRIALAQAEEGKFRADSQTYLQGMDVQTAQGPRDSVGRASRSFQRASTQLFFAGLGGNADDIAAGQIAVAEAEDAARDALTARVSALADIEKASTRNKGKQIAIDLKTLQTLKGVADAAGDVDLSLSLQRQILDTTNAQNDNMNEVRNSFAASRIAELQAMGRDSEAAIASATLARDMVEQARAQGLGDEQIQPLIDRQVAADRAAADSLQANRDSLFSLRQAELNAMGDQVGLADLNLERMRQQYAYSIKMGANPNDAGSRNMRAQIMEGVNAASDARYQSSREDYDWQLGMEKITRTQYVQYLEGLKSTLIPGTKKFKDLELEIKRLKDDVSGNLQMNIPTAINLPTLYEVRRLGQADASGSFTQSAPRGGYQDNRNVQVTVNVNNGMSETQIVNTLSKAMGNGTTGYDPTRY
jgi:hypothetical protein